jgi:ankyrin repeat protein
VAGLGKIGNTSVHSLRDDFAAAARAADVNACRDILEQFGGANVIVDPDGRSMLMVAAGAGSLEICDILIKRGADVNAVDRDGRTALLLAVAYPDVCRALLARGADASIGSTSEDAQWCWPLEAAAGQGYVETCKILIEHAPSVGGEPRRRAILAAAGAAHRNVLNLLQDTWPDEVASRFDEMLVAAAAGGQVDLCGALLERGASSPDALIEAVVHDRVEVAEFLLEHGAAVNAIGSTGLTALHEAAARGIAKGAWWLLESGAEVNVNAERPGWTPLYSAIAGDAENRVQMCRLLAGAGAEMNPECVIKGSLTPFQYAVKLGRVDVVRYFIGELNEDVTQKTVGGRTLLQLAGADEATRTALMESGLESAPPEPAEPGTGSRSRAPLPF